MTIFHTDMPKIYRRGRLLALGLCLFTQFFLPCNALSSGLLIIYPSVKAPYNKIYQDIIKGIESSYPGEKQQIELSLESDSIVISEGIKQYHPDVLVTLGQHSLAKVQELASPLPTIAGAITKAEKPTLGISMTPDPEVILERLLLITPFIERVYVITDAETSAQLIPAKTYLKKRGKALNIEQVTSLQQAADKYLNILNQASRNDAIWLMQGAGLNDPSILALLLEAAWKKEIVVFSSNPNHVKRGALFSVYPDNEKMGQSLAKMAQDYENLKMTGDSALLPLRNLLLIVNKRTSNHLGINPNNISGLDVHRLL